MITENLSTIALLNELFGYDAIIDGDRMTADVYLDDVFLYTLTLEA